MLEGHLEGLAAETPLHLPRDPESGRKRDEIRDFPDRPSVPLGGGLVVVEGHHVEVAEHSAVDCVPPLLSRVCGVVPGGRLGHGGHAEAVENWLS